MAEVVLQNVSKVFPGGIEAVKNVSLDVADGEFVVLVGPSGCGKSTTLRLVAGLEEASGGDIYIGERRVNDVPPKDRDIAMVFQNYALYPHMKVYDNMAFGLKLRKYSKNEIDARVRETAEILGIEELLERKPRALSGGQRQRVAVGRAIVRKPKVFLLDEPLSNLDAKLRTEMRTEIARLHDRLGTTTIYVTHDQVEAMTLGERVVVLKDGVFHQVDTPPNLYNRPANKFVAGFIGSPSMNFLDGRLTATGGSLHFSSADLELNLDETKSDMLKDHVGKKVYLGIRPEDIHSAQDAADLPAGNLIELSVDVVETLGAESLVYLKTAAGNVLVARFKTALAPKGHETIPTLFDVRKAHIFDAETEESLTNEAAG